MPGTELSLLHTVLFNVSPTRTRPEAAEHKAPTRPEAPALRAPTRPEAAEHEAPTRPEAAEHLDTSWTIYCLCPEQNFACDRCPARIWRSELYSLSTGPGRPGSGRGERCDWVSSDSLWSLCQCLLGVVGVVEQAGREQAEVPPARAEGPLVPALGVIRVESHWLQIPDVRSPPEAAVSGGVV